VAHTPGAEFANALRLPPGVHLVSKATAAEVDAYSAFRRTDLHHRLQAGLVRRLFVAGLATDYCVLNTVIDALALGYTVVVLCDGIAAVDAQPGDGARALERMRSAGAALAHSEAVRD
jgi:nicotinamidase/pyrazinamidase